MTSEPLPIGTPPTFEIFFDSDTRAKGLGEVVWARSDGAGSEQPSGMAVRFLYFEGNGFGHVKRCLEGAAGRIGTAGQTRTVGVLEFDRPSPKNAATWRVSVSAAAGRDKA